jgi:hypothetical protein
MSDRFSQPCGILLEVKGKRLYLDSKEAWCHNSLWIIPTGSTPWITSAPSKMLHLPASDSYNRLLILSFKRFHSTGSTQLKGHLEKKAKTV